MRSLPSLLNLAVNRVLCLSANCWSFSLRTCLASSALHTTTFKAEPNQTETIGPFPTTGHGRGPGGSLNLSLRYRM
uniref:Secreted protein n=1 Tax=Salix viminalis TaxID=40686 RepID=A0A6N2N4X9_SALVM